MLNKIIAGHKFRSVLITNDDGIEAAGIRALCDAAKAYAEEITIIAPAKQQSGASFSLTLGRGLTLKKTAHTPNMRAYKIDGTPVDCVKIALGRILKQKQPDLVLSGINHGVNHGQTIFYSGTAGAAIEAAFQNIPAISFSIYQYELENYDFGKRVASDLLSKISLEDFPAGRLLHVTIPNLPADSMIKYRVTSSTPSRWEESYDEKDGLLIHKKMSEIALKDEGDIPAFSQGYVTIVPIKPDLTDRSMIGLFTAMLE
jgi:5'-nucleotidase